MSELVHNERLIKKEMNRIIDWKNKNKVENKAKGRKPKVQVIEL